MFSNKKQQVENQRTEFYTDLALEVRESFPGDGGEIKGVDLKEWYERDTKMKITKVDIMDASGARAMGKPKGTYITLESALLHDEEARAECAEILANYLEDLIPDKAEQILAVGLGNRELTADALGPNTLEKLLVTRHLNISGRTLGAITPGVMAQTGMETAEIIRGIVDETKPDLIVVVDALAARSSSRLCTTIQITNTGIRPGSGLGNRRSNITQESMGVPVIAIGVPTVVGASAIASDTMEALIKVSENHKELQEMCHFMKLLAPPERYDLLKELLEPQYGSLFVTPKDMDSMVFQLAQVIADGINMAVHNSPAESIS